MRDQPAGELRRRLARHDSGLAQFVEARAYVGGRGRDALNRWCDLRKRGDKDETMADLLLSGAVSEQDVRDCFLDAA